MRPLLISLLMFLSSLLYIHDVQAKVDPPNYDFSLDSLSPFMPGQSLGELQKKYGKGTKMGEDGNGVITRFLVEQLRYKFPVLVQSKADVIDNFYASLPTYFLHDVFHQSLINRLGMQDSYKKVEESAVYIWKNNKGLTHVYSGTCTITCFPVYYAVYPQGAAENLLKKMSDQSNYGKFLDPKLKPEEVLAL